jgi:ATP-binding cassette subfamily F protein 3
VLALLIWQKPNLLLLDEPTNHLDLEMRLALNNAIQLFEGTVILVSHDRHLLRTVCDDLLLVDHGKVQAFRQEVDDYPRWLAERRNMKLDDVPGEIKAVPDRKQQKKREAEFRKTIQPQLTRQKRLEREVEKLEHKLAAGEARLAASEIYQDDAKDELQEVLFSQAENKKQLEQVELEWFDISEQIEQMRADFDETAE